MKTKLLFGAIILLIIYLVWVNWPKKKDAAATLPPATDATGSTTATPAAQPEVAINPLIDKIYNDTTCTFCVRDTSLYTSLLAATDQQLTAAHNYWSTAYNSKTGESLASMIASETSLFNTTFATQQTQLATRFKNLNLI